MKRIIVISALSIVVCIFLSSSFSSKSGKVEKPAKEEKTELKLQKKVWVERKKYVIIEAENVEGGFQHTQWVLSTKPEGWSGSGYLIWKGDAIQGEGTEVLGYNDTEESRKLTYHIQITNPGVYYLKVRNYHVGKGTGDQFFDGDNDCFISINKSDFGKQYDHNAREFTWCETGNWRKATFETGIYEVSMAGRSFDFGADRIVLFHNDLAPKGDFGPSPHNWVNEYEWATAPESEVVFQQIK